MSRQTRWRTRFAAASVIVGSAMLLAGCSSAAVIDAESLGLAIAVDTQPGQVFELTVAKDPAISVTGVSAPAGVSATISQPAPDSLTLSVATEPGLEPGTYTLLLRTDRNGEEAELEWPFEVQEGDAAAQVVVSPEEVSSQFASALFARDGGALQAMWPESSWDTLGVDVIESFVPTLDPPACELFDEGSAQCLVFERNDPWVLGLTMEPAGPEGWIITAVSLDSTD